MYRAFHLHDAEKHIGHLLSRQLVRLSGKWHVEASFNVRDGERFRCHDGVVMLRLALDVRAVRVDGCHGRGVRYGEFDFSLLERCCDFAKLLTGTLEPIGAPNSVDDPPVILQYGLTQSVAVTSGAGGVISRAVTFDA